MYKRQELLRRLCKIEGAHWIRLLYCYPNRITDELIDVIATEDKILKYIDLPLQHSVGRVLSEMNRGEDTESLTALIQKMRDRIPNMVIRTTFIAGFPGEDVYKRQHFIPRGMSHIQSYLSLVR